MNDQIREYTEDVVYIMVTKEFYDTAQEYKKGDTRRANFGDEPLDVIPFQITDADRIYSYRCHILKAYGMTENRNGWGWDKYSFTDNDFIKTLSDNDFFEQLEDFTQTHNL